MKRYSLLLLSPLLLGTFTFSETELYGTISHNYQNKQTSKFQYKSPETTQSLTVEHQRQKRKSDLNNDDTFIGIKGEKEIGNGNAIIYQVEVGSER